MMPKPRTHEEAGREIDAAAKPSDAVKAAVAKDLEDHLPADLIPGQATEAPLKDSQREVQEDEPPGN